MPTIRHSRLAIRYSAFASMAVLLLAAWPARAHDPGLSALTIQVRPNALALHLSLARNDLERLTALDLDPDRPLTTAEFQRARPALERMAESSLRVTAAGQELGPRFVKAELEPGDAVAVTLEMPMPPVAELRVESALLEQLPRGHRQFVTVQNKQGGGTTHFLLGGGENSFSVVLGNGRVEPRPEPIEGPQRSAFPFFLMGLEHIATGYDHLVFLLGLLVVGAPFRAAVKIITSFTVAHSLTLALAALDIIRLPVSLVEPLIAASIVYVGLENLFRKEWAGRWKLTFFFGLVHGCGFAAALRDLGVGTDGATVAVPLLSFNLGVEAGQLAVAALVLPMTRWFGRIKENNPRTQMVPGIGALRQAQDGARPRPVTVCSVAIALAGSYWLVTRLLA
jgi:hydrogenase/urease accessory protein HupE